MITQCLSRDPGRVSHDCMVFCVFCRTEGNEKPARPRTYVPGIACDGPGHTSGPFEHYHRGAAATETAPAERKPAGLLPESLAFQRAAGQASTWFRVKWYSCCDATEHNTARETVLYKYLNLCRASSRTGVDMMQRYRVTRNE